MDDKVEEVKGIDGLRFAKDVLAAYDYFGREIPEGATISDSAKSMHNWSGNPENHKDFLLMVKSATDLLQKHSSDKTDAEQIRIEHRSIAELRALLSAALTDSESIEA